MAGISPAIRWFAKLMQPKWYSIRLRPKLIQTTTGTKASRGVQRAIVLKLRCVFFRFVDASVPIFNLTVSVPLVVDKSSLYIL